MNNLENKSNPNVSMSTNFLPISICIPTKDRPEELKRCIKSILEQTVLPSEIVIIDDGNLDADVFTAEKYI